MNSSPLASVHSRIASGTVRRGSRVSSDSVDTASKPRNDRHRIAEPAKIACASPYAGSASAGSSPAPAATCAAAATNTAMNTSWLAIRIRFTRLTSRMPTMFNPVTSTMLATIHTLAGTAGNSCFM